MNQADGAASSTSGTHFAFSILHAAKAIEDRIEGAMSSVGLSMAKHSALSRLEESREPLTLSELAERLSCVRSNITQLVDRLEADGFVRRVADPADRRSVRAELTPLGREKQAAGAAELARVQQELSDQVGNADVAGLESALQSLA
ncbi:MAG TPA: MarR family transcriptional regulator [Gemmatimonadaceae bacterium]|nr:MarR family transcriptional regulator [Gemmatimonadaceae bacterium]